MYDTSCFKVYTDIIIDQELQLAQHTHTQLF